MDLTLRVDAGRGLTTVRLFKDPASPRSYKEFTCAVSCQGHQYRSDIPAAELQEILAFIRSVAISAAGTCGMGLDGVSYELEIDDGRARATYSWWMTPSPGWNPLVEISQRLLQLGTRVSGQYLP